jgi:hypothetical protein
MEELAEQMLAERENGAPTAETSKQLPYRQFSLRTFLVVLTIVCVWFGWQVNRANRQRLAVA